MPDGSEPIDKFGQVREGAVFPEGIHLYLHKFHRSDEDQALHNHPWKWARSLILAGGYVEERLAGQASEWGLLRGLRVERRFREPGSWVRIDGDDYHRVDLLERDSWSLFLAGPKASSWGFFVKKTGEKIPWREFISRIRGDAWDGKKN